MRAMCSARGIGFLEVLEPIPSAEDGPIVDAVRASAARLRASGVPVEDASHLGLDGGTDHGADALAGAIAAALGREAAR
jgi:hypothetical protein